MTEFVFLSSTLGQVKRSEPKFGYSALRDLYSVASRISLNKNDRLVNFPANVLLKIMSSMALYINMEDPNETPLTKDMLSERLKMMNYL